MAELIILVAFLGTLILVVLLMLPFKVIITSTSLKIGRFLPFEIPLRNIENIDIKQQYPKTIRRVHGFDSGDVKRGIFETPDGRQIRLHIYSEYPPFIEIIHQGGLCVLNTKSSEKTEQIFKELKKSARF